MNPTPYKDINEILEQLKTGLVNILGENLSGLYLTGSLTYGDFDRGSSDIDFLAVLSKELSEQQLEAVKKLHSNIGKQYPEWTKRTEGSYITKDMLNNIEPPKKPRPYINRGLINDFVYGNEWTLNLYVLHECGVVLYGPSPRDLFPLPGIDVVRKASKQDLLADWEPKLHKQNPFYNKSFDSNHLRTYAVLTLCRILHRQFNDEVASKRKASAWVKTAYPEWSNLIQKAEKWKHGEKLENEKEVKEFIKFVVNKVK